MCGSRCTRTALSRRCTIALLSLPESLPAAHHSARNATPHRPRQRPRHRRAGKVGVVPRHGAARAARLSTSKRPLDRARPAGLRSRRGRVQGRKLLSWASRAPVVAAKEGKERGRGHRTSGNSDEVTKVKTTRRSTSPRAPARQPATGFGDAGSCWPTLRTTARAEEGECPNVCVLLMLPPLPLNSNPFPWWWGGGRDYAFYELM